VDVSHALWIGGGQGSGKSTIAKALSRRFDLQLYEQVRLYRNSLDPREVEDWSIPFACECGAPQCADEIELSLRQYASLGASGDRAPLRQETP
jgi:hypothetical protein